MPNISYFCEVWFVCTACYHQTGIKMKNHLKQLQTISKPVANKTAQSVSRTCASQPLAAEHKNSCVTSAEKTDISDPKVGLCRSGSRLC